MSTERGITVGKSWPRPTTACNLIPRWEGEFRDHQDWVNFASKRLTVAYDSNGHELKAICVDTLGRRCANGRDMARARDEGTFPVRYFWDCEPSPLRAREIQGLPLTSRMERWGITGLVYCGDHAIAADATGQQRIPLAVAEWLGSRDA